MLRPRHLPSATPRSVRTIALLLFVLQGFVAASPLFEARDADGPPRIHVEHRDAHHPHQHNPDTCALCSARTTTMLASVPVCPLGAGRRRAIVVSAAASVAYSSDAGLDHRSRAPPAITS